MSWQIFYNCQYLALLFAKRKFSKWRRHYFLLVAGKKVTGVKYICFHTALCVSGICKRTGPDHAILGENAMADFSNRYVKMLGAFPFP